MISGFLFKMNAQMQFYEGFTAPFNPAANGWDVQNQSSSIGTNINGWTQGNAATTFSAITGGANDFFSADMNATSSAGTTNTISCWLITPTLNLVNGAFLQFATKGYKLPVAKADRIQVYYSTGTGTNVGTGPGTATNTAGTFTNIVYDLNPNMNANGYFGAWWVVTTSLTGIPTPTVGRLAFRYYIPNGGASGPNGNSIGIDEVRYSLPCNKPFHFGDQNTPTPPCAGSQIPLGITNVTPPVPITSYTWFTGVNTATTSYSLATPGFADIWSLVESTPGCVSLDISTFIALPTPTITYTITPGNVVCGGSSVTVSASGGTSYTYALSANNSATFNPIILTAPTNSNVIATQFTLTGRGANNCRQSQVITLTVNPTPTVSASVSNSLACINRTVTVSATGANSYTWAGAATSTLSQFSYSTGATAGVRQFTVTGTSAQGCVSAPAVRTVTVSLCTGIDENGNIAEALVYPNPFSNQLHFKNFKGTVRIYNQLGQLLTKQEISESESINTTQLTPGLYIIKTLAAGLETGTYKLIKH